MSPALSFVTLDVFTKDRFAGNPLAVVEIPSEIQISTRQLQLIAREFNLSETVFLYQPSTTTTDGQREWRIRIFMTHAELPFAGHPTIGAACLAFGRLGDDVAGTLVCNAGTIDVQYRDGVATAKIPHNVHIHTESPFTLEQVYTLQPALRDRAPVPSSIEVVSPVRGMNFVYVQLADLEALALVQTGGATPRAKLDAAWDVGFTGSYFYVQTGGLGAARLLRTRMIEGALEDAATGSAACGLAAFLALQAKMPKFHCQITQGEEMGRRSEIVVDVTLNQGRDGVEEMWLSGSSCEVMKGTISYA